MMSKVKYVIDENVEQDGANYGTLGHAFVHGGDKHFGRFLSSHIAPRPKCSCLTMTRQIPPSYTHAVTQTHVKITFTGMDN